MKALKEYTIPFVGLKLGKHQFEYFIQSEFFQNFEFEEFNDSKLTAFLDFNKKGTHLELNFKVEGIVNVNCDVTTEPFDLPVNNELFMVVKFGEDYNDENEELLILPHGEYEINVAHYIYECIVLGVPSKRVHPGVENGTLKSDILDRLASLAPKQKKESNKTEDDVDPRWNKLKNLLKD